MHVCNAYTEHVRTAVARAIMAGSDLVVINVSWASGLVALFSLYFRIRDS